MPACDRKQADVMQIDVSVNELSIWYPSPKTRFPSSRSLVMVLLHTQMETSVQLLFSGPLHV